jgi:hypothetical protein
MRCGCGNLRNPTAGGRDKDLSLSLCHRSLSDFTVESEKPDLLLQKKVTRAATLGHSQTEPDCRVNMCMSGNLTGRLFSIQTCAVKFDFGAVAHFQKLVLLQ